MIRKKMFSVSISSANHSLTSNLLSDSSILEYRPIYFMMDSRSSTSTFLNKSLKVLAF